jgi:hypothetical protein
MNNFSFPLNITLGFLILVKIFFSLVSLKFIKLGLPGTRTQNYSVKSRVLYH